MERTTFLDYFRICANREGVPHELSRIGGVITYKAVDERTGDTVALKLIPVASIESAARAQFEQDARAAERINHINIARVFAFGHEEDHFVYVSEFLQGEPLASWVEQHGPMPPDAVLRVAEQIVSVLSTASFHKLTHCAIQPSNLRIVPGSTPEGGWPFVKLMNFGLAGLKIGSDGPAEHEGSFSVAPPFASPEHLQHATVDFRSEVYSLGATMFFLLTGSAPPADLRRQQLGAFPKPLRNLLGNMLRHDPDQRPKDPVALEEMIRQCMAKIERRRALAQKLGIPLAVVIPRKSETPSTPFAQVLRGILAFAALVFAAGVLATFFLPDDLNPFRHRTAANQVIGVPVGVPESSPPVPPRATNTEPVVANQPATNAAMSPAADQGPSPSIDQGQASNPDSVAAATSRNGTTSTPSASTESADQTESNATAQASVAPEPANTTSSTGAGKREKAPVSRTKRGRTGQAFLNRQGSKPASARGRWARARVVGITSDGRLVLRLPSGRTAIVAPDSDEGEFVPRRHRRVFTERDEMFAPPPRFAPDYFPYD
jgi:serine/threonine protein kinase